VFIQNFERLKLFSVRIHCTYMHGFELTVCNANVQFAHHFVQIGNFAHHFSKRCAKNLLLVKWL
jgi:hypothetical protein